MIFLLGLAIGVPLGAWFAWERFLRYERPTVEIRVTPELMREIDAQVVGTWIAAHGLVVMPKGREFKWPTGVRG